MDIDSEFATSSVDIREAARFLGFKSPERLRQKLAAGEYPGFKITNRWMMRKSVLIAIVEEEEKKNAARKNKKKKAKK